MGEKTAEQLTQNYKGAPIKGLKSYSEKMGTLVNLFNRKELTEPEFNHFAIALWEQLNSLGNYEDWKEHLDEYCVCQVHDHPMTNPLDNKAVNPHNQRSTAY